ncbi:MAG: hypothetical protein KBD15_02880 [Candidatus Magasanikbacteria bacterium]|jgi:type IV secretory pathway VirB2 component (pilin)|nr:hypothetical protein [Candidatus Magasanikbacteria bacterium]
MKNRFSLVSLCLIISGIFLFGNVPVSAQSPSSAPIGRYCDFSVSIIGVNEQTAGNIANLTVEQQATFLKNNQGQSFCSAERKSTQEGSFYGRRLYQFGDKINVLDIYNRFSAISKSDAEKEPKPALFFDGEIMKTLEADGSEFTCYPLPGDVFIRYADLTNTQYLSAEGAGITRNAVNKQSCPEINGRFYVPIGNDLAYIFAIDIITGPLAYTGDDQFGEGTGPGTGIAKMATELNRINASSIPEFLGKLIKIAMGILGTIALVIIVYAGILWMTAAGNSTREKEALDTIFWAILGVIVILSSYALVKFIIGNAF